MSSPAPEASEPLRLLDHPIAEARGRLEAILRSLDQPAYRARQVMTQLLRRRVRSFDRMTDLPAAVRPRLAERVHLGLLELAHRAASADGTVKYLWRLHDGHEIESVAIPQDGWLSFCVSSQAGCALRCTFCATASLGLQRNLTAGEIVDQVLAMLEDLGEAGSSLSVVFMGMGEPGYNMDAVLAACRSLNDAEGVGIGARHLTVSTSGVVPAMQRLAAEPLQIRLAVSLHSADQAKREQWMNVAKRFPLNELRQACRSYHDTTGRLITLEYAVMPGLNDSADDAARLAEFAGAVGAKINLIPYNPIDGFDCRPATPDDTLAFRSRLGDRFGGSVMIRNPRGRDIEAACGMLHRARASAT